MKNVFSILFFVVVSTMLYAQSSPAIGEPAPPLYIREWIKGEPVTEFKKSHVYVVEFTAVSCPPCRKAIPHLAQLARQYADKVTVLSIYTLESNKRDTTDLRYLTKIHKLANTLDSLFIFPVAADVPQQTTAFAWGITGTPSIFVVNQNGRIVWSGHESKALDSILPKVIDQTFDAVSAKSIQIDFNKRLNHTMYLKQSGRFKEADRLVDSLIRQHPEFKSILYDYKFKVLAGDDDTRAYELLRWMLTQELEGFTWDKFLSKTWVYPKQLEYDVILQTADRAIKEAETDYVQVSVLMEKAIILRQRSRSEPANSRTYIEAAVEVMRQAMLKSESTKDPEFEGEVEGRYYYYNFLSLAGSDDEKATNLLRWMLENKYEKVEWFNLIDEALLLQRKPDYDLLISITDFVRERATNRLDYPYAMFALGWKAKLFLAVGEKQRAISTYEEAIKIGKKYLDGKSVNYYENRLNELSN